MRPFWRKDNRSSHGWSARLATFLSRGTLEALLCQERQRRLTLVWWSRQSLEASSWPLEVSSGTAKRGGMCWLARPSITADVFTAILAGGYLDPGGWGTALVFAYEGNAQSKGVTR